MTDFAKPFVIGLKPLPLEDWIYIPDDLETYLAEKDRISALHTELVFFEEANTQASQTEVKDALAAYLLDHHRERYSGDGDKLIVDGARHVELRSEQPDLLTAAQLISDDLVIMRRDDTGWRLVAASLCFPSSWSLREKAGLALTQIHQPVPDFGEGTRNASVINRLFDNLEPDQIVNRQNWSLYPEGDLYHPNHNTRNHGDSDDFITNPFIRTERQTLRKMEQSGDILFTIGIEVRRMTQWRDMPDFVSAFEGLASHIENMSEAETDYKGLVISRERLAKTLRKAARPQRM